ncbi:MAG TPA: xanthine dehydrogenase family protein subunit M [Alicyclobacillus sp.]|nr:xanthine dehydrogenase family protein subunit M [Alicyclobacillus sp.]
MIPAAFAYERARSVQEAVQLLEAHQGEAKVLSGGHSLIPLLKLRLTSPGVLVDIGGISELRGISVEGDRVVVGALTTHGEVASSDLVRDKLPVLAEAAKQVGDLQVRNRGTVGGNIAHADPASDLPAVALALDAVVAVEGPSGPSEVPVADFILGPLLTSLGASDVVVSVAFPIPQGSWKGAYEKYPHPASGYAVAGVAAVLGVENGIIRDARVGITGVADTPYRAREVEAALIGQPAGEEAVRRASERADAEGSFSGDLFASEDYRRHLSRVYTRKALLRCLS